MSNFIGRLVGAFIGLCFAGGGAVLLVTTVVPVFKTWDQTKTWQPGLAQLESVDGSDSETRARYRYSIDGRMFVCERVYLADFKDNIGSYHSKLQDRLKYMLRTETPVAVWVNSENPGEAVIDREIRWGLMLLIFVFCAVFMLVGLTVCVACVFAGGRKKVKGPATAELKREWEQKKSEQPDYREGFIEYRQYRLHDLKNETEKELSGNRQEEQWREKKEWQTSRIRSDAKSGARGMWIFAVLWCVISSPVLFFLQGELLTGNYLALIGLIFPLAGIYLLAKAIGISREFHRFGIVEYCMDPYPGSIGGNVGGTLNIRNVQETHTLFKVKLECVFSYESGSDGDKSRYENIRWAEEGIARTARISGGVKLEFRFDVPQDLPESEVKRSGDYYLWRLKVTAELPGVDLNRTYIIPVFKTSEGSRHVRHDLSQQAKEARQQASEKSRMALANDNLDSTGLSRSVRIQKLHPGLLLVYPMFRNKILTLIACLFGGCFGGSAVGIMFGLAGRDFFGIVAFIVALPFALIGFFATAAAVYMPLNNLRVTIVRGRVTILRRLAVLPTYYKQINSSDIAKLTVKKSGSTGQGTGKVEHFQIVAHTKAGDTIILGEDIDGIDLADQFKDYLWEKIHGGLQEQRF